MPAIHDWRCINCRTRNDTSNTACWWCGALFSQQRRRCSICNGHISVTSAVCTTCFQVGAQKAAQRAGASQRCSLCGAPLLGNTAPIKMCSACIQASAQKASRQGASYQSSTAFFTATGPLSVLARARSTRPVENFALWLVTSPKGYPAVLLSAPESFTVPTAEAFYVRGKALHEFGMTVESAKKLASVDRSPARLQEEVRFPLIGPTCIFPAALLMSFEAEACLLQEIIIQAIIAKSLDEAAISRKFDKASKLLPLALRSPIAAERNLAQDRVRSLIFGILGGITCVKQTS